MFIANSNKDMRESILLMLEISKLLSNVMHIYKNYNTIVEYYTMYLGFLKTVKLPSLNLRHRIILKPYLFIGNTCEKYKEI
jgi:hypothetical protein